MVTPSARIETVNTILYCRHWHECVQFYEGLGFARTFSNDWFVEFRLNSGACLSVADQRRASIKSAAGQGITMTFQVSDLDKVWNDLQAQGYAPESIAEHRWDARRFYLFDPEGNRLEFWQPLDPVSPPQ